MWDPPRLIPVDLRAPHRAKEKREAIDITIADFDGVTYHVTTNAGARNIVMVSISWSAIPDIRPLGMAERLANVYGSMITEAEVGYDLSIQFDVDNPPCPIGTRLSSPTLGSGQG